MKALYTWLVLAGAGFLPACTVHYYGVAPDGSDYRTHRTRVVRTHSTDTVYVAGSNTTVITQPGTVGGPRGGYAGNGPIRQPAQPPVRGGYGQPGGVRTPPGSYPPPGTNGGIRTPTGGQPTSPSTGTTQTPPTGTTSGPIRNPNTGSTGAGNGPVRGGSTAGSTGSSAPSSTTASGGGSTGSQAPQTYTTGGIKPIPGSGGGSQTPQTYPTGGIKPIPSTSTGPISSSTPAGGNGEVPNPRTGGVKPVRAELPTTAADTPAQEYPTGGIKPIPGTTANNGQTSGTSGQGHQDLPTGGIKPMRDEPMTAPGTTTVMQDTPGSHAETPASPAMAFAKMPCRGTCPWYTATIWPDGRVQYEGKQNVPHIGKYELRLAPATVADIRKQAQGLGFAELQESYASGMTDIPATMLTMYWDGGGSKTVSVEDNAPAELQALFDHINNTLNELVASSQFSEEKPRSEEKLRRVRRD